MACVFGYTRISTDDTKQIYSLEGQAEQIRLTFLAKAARPDHAFAQPGVRLIEQPHQDMISAYKYRFRDRPAGSRLYNEAQRGDHILAVSYDRAFRDTRDMLDTLDAFELRGVTMHFLNVDVDPSTAMGRLIMTILTGMAAWEVQNRGDRVRRANDVRLLVKKIPFKHPPWGWKWRTKPGRETRPIPDIEERITAEAARSRYMDTESGKYGQVAAWLKAQKIYHSPARQKKNKYGDRRLVTAGQVKDMIFAAKWCFPLPAGSANGYIPEPTVDADGKIVIPNRKRTPRGLN